MGQGITVASRPKSAPAVAGDSWWTSPMTREEFSEEIARRHPGATPPARGYALSAGGDTL